MGGAFPCGLSYDVVTAYGRDRGFGDPEMMDEFVLLVYVCDTAYIEDFNARAKKAADAAKTRH